MKGDRSIGDNCYLWVRRAVQWQSWKQVSKGRLHGMEIATIQDLILQAGGPRYSDAAIKLRLELHMKGASDDALMVKMDRTRWALKQAKDFMTNWNQDLEYLRKQMAEDVKKQLAMLEPLVGELPLTVSSYIRYGKPSITVNTPYGDGWPAHRVLLLLKLAVRGHIAMTGRMEDTFTEEEWTFMREVVGKAEATDVANRVYQKLMNQERKVTT